VGGEVLANAAAVRQGRITARAVAERTLGEIRAHDPAINAVTRLLADRTMDEAQALTPGSLPASTRVRWPACLPA
jgi:aspartyl-tRNA(Asn)/glutamyl-tRNA(Gln) amidotransferase subunit A